MTPGQADAPRRIMGGRKISACFGGHPVRQRLQVNRCGADLLRCAVPVRLVCLPLDQSRLTTRERGVSKAMYTARFTGSNEVRARSLRQVLVDVLAASMVPCSWISLELLLVSTDREHLIAVRDGKSPEAISSMTCNQSIKSVIRPLSSAKGSQRSQLQGEGVDEGGAI